MPRVLQPCFKKVSHKVARITPNTLPGTTSDSMRCGRTTKHGETEDKKLPKPLDLLSARYFGYQLESLVQMPRVLQPCFKKVSHKAARISPNSLPGTTSDSMRCGRTTKRGETEDKNPSKSMGLIPARSVVWNYKKPTSTSKKFLSSLSGLDNP